MLSAVIDYSVTKLSHLPKNRHHTTRYVFATCSDRFTRLCLSNLNETKGER